MFYKSVVVIFITKITDYAKVVKPKVCLSDVAFTIRGNKKIYILRHPVHCTECHQ